MPDIPAAEVDVTIDLIASLLADQHPGLADLPLRIVANGWDNVMARLGEDLAVRMPRRAMGARLMEHEQDWLPVLAPRLPVPVPTPVRTGGPGRGYPWRWSIVPWFEGVPLNTVPVTARDPLAVPFAEFFATLHAPAPADAPTSAVRGVPLGTRAGHARSRIERWPAPNVLTTLWEECVAAPAWDGPPLWIHGDPHPANVVARPLPGATELAAVVDFGDMAAGDPASDLATAWLTFDPSARTAFRSRYDELTGRDDDTWRRARGWALHLSLMFLTECDDVPELRAIGEHGIDQVRHED